MAKTWEGPPLLKSPTAQTLPTEGAATPRKKLALLPGLGLATCFQAVPFQCAMMVGWPMAVVVAPTAQASLAEVAAAPSRVISVTGPDGLGLTACTHFVPFQRRIRVLPAVPVNELPTAQALLAEVAVTASSRLPVPGAGLATWDHFVPFQRRTSVLLELESRASPTAQALVADTASTPL